MTAGFFSANQFGDLASAWWSLWHERELNPDLMSQSGVYVMDGASVVAIAYLYPTIGSKMIYLGFTVRDPKLDRIRADEALTLLLSEVEHVARTLGYSIIQSTFETEPMKKRVKKAGYKAAAETQIFVKELDNGRRTEPGDRR